ncbi:phage tail protein [Silvimonas sp. JCM 19000]
MAKSQTTPFRGSKISILSGVLAAKAVTALSKANPAVATLANHNLIQGDVVRLAGFGADIDGDYAVNVVSDSTFQVLGLDTTNATFAVSATTTVAEATWLDIAEITNFQEAGRSISQIETTTVASEETESEPGLPSAGTVQLTFNAAPDVASQTQLAAYETNGEKFWSRLTLPRGRGYKLYYGYISTGAGLDGAVNGVYTSGVTIQLSGPKYYVKQQVA